jgi:hypothetical protein
MPGLQSTVYGQSSNYFDFSFGRAFSAVGSKNTLNLTNILAVRFLVCGGPREGLEDPSWLHAKAAVEEPTLVRDIHSILSLFRGSQSRMEVDKIFGLLGLCREMNNAQTFGVEEDYSLSVQEAYTRTAISILEGGQNLDLFAALRLQSYNENISSLPSWVPDWSNTEHPAIPLHAGSASHTMAKYSEFECRVENAM